MADEKDMEETEQELLQALAAQTPVEEFSVTEGEPLSQDEKKASKEEIIEVLRTICDPEIVVNIYDLGLVYDIRQLENGDIEVDMTLTAPTCPVAGILPRQAAQALAELKGVGKATVNLVWEPAWTPDRLTDEAKAILEMY
ncbi:MAG: DUF59 domain-containing protein [Alphaproteobacteria bacterium]|nr:DUF59 domain-containing protein [Alphaproteobacteria bacterium]